MRQLVSRETREVRAVYGISFDIPRGQLVEYIGPNGAGKSTTVKMLTGILHPTSGTVRVNGLSPQRQRQTLARQIGVVFGQRTQLWWDLPTVDSFEMLAAMYDIPAREYKVFLREFGDLLALDEFLGTPVRRLSLGQRMRADIAAGLIHRPTVLFLDEPTIGLDVVAKGRIREFLARISKQRGVTILLTTHDLRDIEELCERVMVINHGKLIFDGTLESLRNRAGLPTVLSVKYARLPEGLEVGQYMDAQGRRKAEPDSGAWQIISVDYVSQTVDVAFDRGQSPAPVVLWAMQVLGDIKDVSLTEAGIEETVKWLLAL